MKEITALILFIIMIMPLATLHYQSVAKESEKHYMFEPHTPEEIEAIKTFGNKYPILCESDKCCSYEYTSVKDICDNESIPKSSSYESMCRDNVIREVSITPVKKCIERK